jgi:hypothetical protein
LNDIRRLEICKTAETFKIGAKLFIAKWENTDQSIDDFLEYFKSEKLETSKNWYEAVAECVPSTSNGIESGNRLVKDNDTFRERWPIGRFQSKSLEIVHHWSNDRNPKKENCKHYQMFPCLNTQVWKNAYSWLKVNL